jgi:hypothetical protein
MRKIIVPFLTLVLLLGILVPAYAQGQFQAYAQLDAPNSTNFPTITALLDVFDTQAHFAEGLKPENLTVFEDGQPRPVDALSEQTVGLQLVVAVNPGPSLSVRDSQGASRYERVVQGLSDWANALPTDNQDDISLVSTTGPLLAHSQPKEWVASLNAYQPNFNSAVPSLQTLSFALDLLNVPPPQPGMKRAILLLTPHLDDPNLVAALQPLADQAIRAKVRIFVWMIDTDLYSNFPNTIALNDLAVQSGGSFFTFSGVEPLPDPESYFANLRHIYQLTYTSQLNKPGDHTLAVKITAFGGELTSPQQTFSLDIQPPNPILVSPPLQIVRQPPENKPFDSQHLQPAEQPIEIIVEFPDNHPRPLVDTALYVDGQIVAENKAEPFDKFTWDLSGYDTSGQHQLMVSAEDSLGLKKTSLGVPVVVTVVHPPSGPVAFLSRYSLTITISAISVAGAALLFILISGGRLRLSALFVRRQTRKLYEDPLTQPVAVSVPKRQVKSAKGSRGLPWRRRPKLVEAPAYLVRLTVDGQPATGNPIPLVGGEMTFGNDPVLATQVLDDPSVSPLHARLKQNADGSFILVDEGSVAGTWVNYEPITSEGQRLRHGDVIHFGQLSYRFNLQKPPETEGSRLSAP